MNFSIQWVSEDCLTLINRLSTEIVHTQQINSLLGQCWKKDDVIVKQTDEAQWASCMNV